MPARDEGPSWLPTGYARLPLITGVPVVAGIRTLPEDRCRMWAFEQMPMRNFQNGS